MSISIRVRFCSDGIRNYGEVARFIEQEGNCTVTSLCLDSVDPQQPVSMENVCKKFVVCGPGVDKISDLVKEKFPELVIE